MRATDGLQTTLTLGSVNHDGQAFSLGLSLEMCLPRLQQDEHLPDQIEACVHQAGLEVQRRLFQVLIEKADQELVLQHRHGKGGAGIQRRGTRPFTFKTIFGEVTVQRSRISHNHDGTIEIPSATVWNTSHQLAVTENLREAVCDQTSDQSAAKSRADVSQFAGDGSLLGRSTVIEIVRLLLKLTMARSPMESSPENLRRIAGREAPQRNDRTARGESLHPGGRGSLSASARARSSPASSVSAEGRSTVAASAAGGVSTSEEFAAWSPVALRCFFAMPSNSPPVATCVPQFPRGRAQRQSRGMALWPDRIANVVFPLACRTQ